MRKKLLAILLCTGILLATSTSTFAKTKTSEAEPSQTILSEYNLQGSLTDFQITISQLSVNGITSRTSNSTAVSVPTDLGVKNDITVMNRLPDNKLIINYANENMMAELQPDGSLVFHNMNGEMVGAADKLIFTDLNDRKVSTDASQNGNIIDYVINDEDAIYPLRGEAVVYSVNDFSKWFSNGTWITRDGMVSLSLTHTGWAYTGMSTGPISWSWNTVVSKFSSATQWYNATGLREQYQCHINGAPLKNPWNIEPARPAVGLINTMAAGCNPI